MTPKETRLSPESPAPTAEAPFYGWRLVPHVRPDGTREFEHVPLTLEDVLHPQEGDIIPENPRHALEREYLRPVLESRLQGLRNGLALTDCLVDWGVPGLRNTSPDISLFEDVVNRPDPDKGTFHLAESGGAKCVLVIELVSPETRDNDVTRKFEEYHRAGVPLYIIVDVLRDGSRRLLAYEHTPAGYVPIPLTERGRVELPRLGVCLGLGEERVVLYDTVTGEELGDWGQERAARQTAQREARAEAEARQVAEEKARAEVEARKVAEEKARAEVEARKVAEEKARAEVEARKVAEEKARAEVEARKLAEKQAADAQALLRQLEDLLRQMQGGAGPAGQAPTT